MEVSASSQTFAAKWRPLVRQLCFFLLERVFACSFASQSSVDPPGATALTETDVMKTH